VGIPFAARFLVMKYRIWLLAILSSIPHLSFGETDSSPVRSVKAPSQVVLVAITRKSTGLAKRSLISRVLEKLSPFKPRAVGIDLFFPDGRSEETMLPPNRRQEVQHVNDSLEHSIARFGAPVVLIRYENRRLEPWLEKLANVEEASPYYYPEAKGPDNNVFFFFTHPYFEKKLHRRETRHFFAFSAALFLSGTKDRLTSYHLLDEQLPSGELSPVEGRAPIQWKAVPAPFADTSEVYSIVAEDLVSNSFNPDPERVRDKLVLIGELIPGVDEGPYRFPGEASPRPLAGLTMHLFALLGLIREFGYLLVPNLR
jgi:hypothetical protein